MRTTRLTFEEVRYKAIKRIKTENGWKLRQKTFSQTISPFNKNGDGSVKTRHDIHVELVAEAEVWKNEP